MKNFQDLAVWEISHRLTLDVYRTSQSFPRDEIYGLISQIRRASASIPAIIAEGCGRGSDCEVKQMLTGLLKKLKADR